MDEGVRVTEPDPTMAAIHEGLQLHLSGDRAAARARFSDLWNEIGENGDPLHRCAVAHYMADVRDEPAEELEWDLRATRQIRSPISARRRFTIPLSCKASIPRCT
jgi:hypothetical protein